MIILLHSSKTMRHALPPSQKLATPSCIGEAIELDAYLKSLSPARMATLMKISKPLAIKTSQLIAKWGTKPIEQSAAIDSFIGDIYSGLQAHTLSDADRVYAHKHLYILSGLYGVLKALDGIMPYRFEMGYRPQRKKYQNLYTFWGDKIAKLLPEGEPIVNLSSAEYDKVVIPFVDSSRVIRPKFLTKHPKTGVPTFVTVHAKVARGAFAHWLIVERIKSSNEIEQFTNLKYKYDASLSTPSEPVFVCDTYGGLGLSVRLQH